MSKSKSDKPNIAQAEETPISTDNSAAKNGDDTRKPDGQKNIPSGFRPKSGSGM